MTIARACLFLVLGACGARSALPGAGLDGTETSFAGDYDCTLTCGPNCTGTESFTLVQSSGEIDMVFDTLPSQPCSLKFIPSGDTATLVPGQTCEAQQVTFVYTSGALTLVGEQLHFVDAYSRRRSDGASDGTGADDAVCSRRSPRADAGNG